MEEIDLKELFKLFWKKKAIIILTTMAFLFVGYIYNAFITTPEYRAATTLILVKSESASSVTQADVTLNQKLVYTYSELVKSDTVLNEVVNRIQLNKSVSQLRKNITIESVKNTEILKISVLDSNKDEAAIIANSIAEVFSEQVKEIYNMENIRVVDKAVAPSSPSNINPVKYAGIFAIVGFAISVGVILVLNLFDSTVKSDKDIEKSLNIKTLASFAKNQNARPGVIDLDPKSQIAEGFKSLRTNLQFMKGSEGLKSVLITSSLPGEGKSWVATNLAITFARGGYRTILVDADMRKGVQHKKFKLKQVPGLSDFLNSSIEDYEGELPKYIQPTELDNLCVLPCGSITYDSSELLLSNRIIKTVETLKKNCDIVIFDATPSNLVTDAVVLSRLVDTSFIVTEHEKTQIDDIAKIKTQIEDVGGNVAGIVINKVQDDKNSKGNYYYMNEDYVRKRKTRNRR